MLHDPGEVKLFPRLPADAIDQLRAHGQERELHDGAALFTEGDPDYHFWVVLDGEVRVTKRVGDDETLLAIHGPGEFAGEISILTGGSPIATGRASGAVRALRIDAPTFRQIVADGTPLAATIVAAMTNRTQDVDAQLRQQEKLAALGKLSAGLAHELNNPAAAAQRAIGSLRTAIARVHADALAHDERFTAEQRERLRLFQRELIARAAPARVLDPLEQSDAEDALAGWLDDHQIENSWELAPTLVAAGLDVERLETLAEQFSDEALALALAWLEPALTLHELTGDVERSTRRISELVGAMKAYSYMDQAAVQEIDLHRGLEDTLTILHHKLKGGIEVTREYDRSIPLLCAYGSELNQVWTNLIDNAIDAMNGSGHLTIRTAREHDWVRIEIADDGPGIPLAIQQRIWEPFFTTKSVGKGTGLGLDIALRIICRRHNGDIRVHSQPGSTVFVIRLPLDQSSAA